MNPKAPPNRAQEHDVVFRLAVPYEDERKGFPVYRAMMKAAADLGVKADVEFSSALSDQRSFHRNCTRCNRTMTIRLEEWGTARARTFDMDAAWPPEIDALYRLAGWSPDAGSRHWKCAACDPCANCDHPLTDHFEGACQIAGCSCARFDPR